MATENDVIKKMAEAMKERISAGSHVPADHAGNAVMSDEAAVILARAAFNAVGHAGWCIYELDEEGMPKIPR